MTLEAGKGGFFAPEGGLSVGGPASFGARRSSVSAGASIVIDPCAAATKASFVRITSDGTTAANALSLRTGGAGCVPAEGQIMVIYNGDEERTTGSVEVPSGKSVLFVFSEQAGPGWVPLTTLDARSSQLEGITRLIAASNLDIGPFTLKAQQLVAAGQEQHQV